MRPHAGEVRGLGAPARADGRQRLWRSGAARNLQDPLSIRCVRRPTARSTTRCRSRVGRWRSSSTRPATTRSSSSTRTRSSRSATSTSSRWRWRSTTCGSASHTPRAGRQRARPEDPLGPLQRAADRPDARRRARPAGCAARARVRRRSRPRRASSPTRSRSTTAASSARASRTTPRWRRWRSATTSHLVGLMYRLVALELIVAAQAVDLRGDPEGIGEGPRSPTSSCARRVPTANRRDGVERRHRRADAADRRGCARRCARGATSIGGAPEPLRARARRAI